MAEHPGEGDFERFVRGELGARDEALFEGHVASCEACSARLAGAARLELGLREVATLAPTRARVGQRGALWAVASASLVALFVAAASFASSAPPGEGTETGPLALAPSRPHAAPGLRAPSHSPLDDMAGGEGAR